jgi:hypothetical protein
MAVEAEHDKNKDGLHDAKAEKYLNPDRNKAGHADPTLDVRRQAGVKQGMGIFLILLGSLWLLDAALPDIPWLAVVAIVGGWYLLQGGKRKK